MGRERGHGEHRELINPTLRLTPEQDNRAQQIEVHCVHCWGQTMESAVRVSTRALGFWSAKLISMWSVWVHGVNPLSLGVLYSIGPSNSAEYFWQISTDKLSKTQAPFQHGKGRSQSLLCSITRCAKLFEVRRLRERGETSFEDERSLVGTRVQASSLETLEAGCRISVILPSTWGWTSCSLKMQQPRC